MGAAGQAPLWKVPDAPACSNFAELTGHHRTYIGFLERGERSPNIETVQRVAQALGLNASDLLREAGY